MLRPSPLPYKKKATMNRRQLLALAGALAALATPAFAADDHKHHQHAAGNKFGALQAAAADCVAKGDACLAHCLVLLGRGDRSMAGCAQAVNQMLTLCGALQKLAAQQSRYTAGQARVALNACIACEKECRKHEDKHAECKACAESCANCIKECKAMLG